MKVLANQKKAEKYYLKFMESLGLDTISDHSIETPKRVVKAFINDLFKGIYETEPNITAFDNTDNYDGIIFQGNIDVRSVCSHHHLPFVGKAYVAYIPSPNGKIIGLSKLNRIVDYFARRPQVQENLTMQIHDYLNQKCEGNLGVAVYIEANHTCCSLRGIKHNSQMKTSKLSGNFFDDEKARNEFYQFIK